VRTLILFASLALIACRSPLPDPTRGQSGSAALEVEPAADLSAVFPVSRIRIGDPSATGALLIEGELSDYYVRKIRAGEPPNTLLERAVDCVSWADADSLWLSPTTSLVPGSTYSVATEGEGLLGTLVVGPEPLPVLARLFPPPDSAGAPIALYCGAPSSELEAETYFQPGDVVADVVRGVFGDAEFPDCVSLSARNPVPEGILVPPLAIAGVQLEPLPLSVAVVPVAPPLGCEVGESSFDAGCVQVLDDRAIVRSPSVSVWSLSGGIPPLLVTAAAGGRFMIHDLQPDTTYTFELGVVDVLGNARKQQQTISTLPAMPHVVINEVLANPLGAEPAQEWVELVNDGTIAVQLDGYRLVDAAGESVLPPHVLAPAAFVLLAREDFQNDDGSDVPVPADVVVLALPSLGKNGLTNSGERLELKTPEGLLVSAFPALPKPKAGISVARREPWSFDDDAEAFLHHGDPGASPGAPNLP
jgi:hypothetical protein